jgi:acetyltransferase-like isoleucine patch superfamily enzyme
MPYLTNEELSMLGFKKFGNNVKVSDKASIYDAERIEIGDNSRVDDFCVLSGSLKIGRNVHITPQCLVAGGELGVIIEDFVALAYGVKVFSQSDDYSGLTMTNSTVPVHYKNELKAAVKIDKHSIVGAGSIILPGVTVAEGTSIGAASLVNKTTSPWYIYAGIPAKKLKKRKTELLALEKEYLENEG